MTTEQMDWLDDERAGRHQPLLQNDPTLFEVDADARGAETVAAELKGLHIAPQHTEQVEKARKGQSLRDIGREQVQETMRREMTDIKKIEAELLNKQIPQAAQAIINEYELTLSLGQWQIVQAMVEDGIRAGLAIRTMR